jgi:hypothetical protein
LSIFIILFIYSLLFIYVNVILWYRFNAHYSLCALRCHHSLLHTLSSAYGTDDRLKYHLLYNYAVTFRYISYNKLEIDPARFGSFIYLLTYLFMIYLFIHSFIYLFIDLFFIYSLTFVYLFIYFYVYFDRFSYLLFIR